MAPPSSLVWSVERWAPGVYLQFWNALVEAHRASFARATSYYRTPDENRRVQGAPDSQHLIGLALDVVYATQADKRQALDRARALGLLFVDESDHVHFQAWPPGIARGSGVLGALNL